jgi:hypothetical protein
VHIVVYCPSCRSRYQIDPQLQGKLMRCPNAACREVFEVRADEAEAEQAPKPDSGSPGVTSSPVPNPLEQVPFFAADMVQQAAEEKSPASAQVEAAELDEARIGPQEGTVGAWHTPPPVRRRAEARAPITDNGAAAQESIVPAREPATRGKLSGP